MAGARDGQGGFLDYFERMEKTDPRNQAFQTNTTLAVVANNAKLTKAEANKAAQMAHDGLARTIVPIHTMNDGDTVFSLATGQREASVDVIGALSAEVLAEAVVRAVKSAQSVNGFPASSEYK